MATAIVEKGPGTFCFDEHAKFVFICTGGKSTLRVRPWNDKASASVTDTSVVSMTTSPSSPTEAILELQGTKAGYTELHIACDSSKTSKWRVLVGDPVEITIACHLVHGKDAATTSTALTVSDSIVKANSLLDAANVRLNANNYPTDTLVLDRLEGAALIRGSLNPFQRIRTARQSHLLAANRARGADINAFFLASLQIRDGVKWDLNGLAFPRRNMVFVEDQATADLIGQTLAHEVTHARGSLVHANAGRFPTALMLGDCSGTELRLGDVLNLRKESLPYGDTMATL